MGYIELQFLQEASEPNRFTHNLFNTRRKNMFNMEKFARLLSGKRREKGLTQEQLADLVGVTHQAVSKWERAEVLPEISKMGDIAKAVDTPAEELIGTLYGIEMGAEAQNEAEPQSNADAEYFALGDKTKIGDVYALAPRLSKETLQLAIDTIISEKGTAAAAMLYKFADSEYLSKLGKRLMARGDTSLAAYVDEDTIKGAVIDAIATADMQSEVWRRDSFYTKAGELLANCTDSDFINEMFVHLVGHVGVWDPWRNSIQKFPSDVVVKQGTRFMIWKGPSAFRTWWDAIGRRNMAHMFIGYADHFENNAQAWKDISAYCGYADRSILERAIKDRLENPDVDPSVFRPLYNYAGDELKMLLKNKLGITSEPVSDGNGARPNGSSKNAFFEKMVNDRIHEIISESLRDADLDELPDIIQSVRNIGIKFAFNNPNGNTGAEDAHTDGMVAILEKLNELSERFDEIESRLDDLESRIDDLED